MRGSARPNAVEESTAEARFAEIYERCYPSIHAYCARRTAAHRVDDGVAETFLVAWRRIDDVPTGREALLWLYRVAYRVVGHDWRSDARQRRLETRAGSLRTPEPASPEDRAVADDECRLVLDAIAELKPAEAELLLLVAWERLSPAELAAVLDVSPNTASQRLSRARRKLGHKFDQMSTDPDRAPAASEGGV